jgi:hypothetical protein
MRFIVIIKQWGEGCDYMIGCGTTAKTIEATDLQEAREKVKELFFKDYCYEAEGYESVCNIDSIIIAPSPEYLPVDDWWHRHLSDEHYKEQVKKEAEEKLELARLLNKYKDR